MIIWPVPRHRLHLHNSRPVLSFTHVLVLLSRSEVVVPCGLPGVDGVGVTESEVHALSLRISATFTLLLQM